MKYTEYSLTANIHSRFNSNLYSFNSIINIDLSQDLKADIYYLYSRFATIYFSWYDFQQIHIYNTYFKQNNQINKHISFDIDYYDTQDIRPTLIRIFQTKIPSHFEDCRYLSYLQEELFDLRIL